MTSGRRWVEVGNLRGGKRVVTLRDFLETMTTVPLLELDPSREYRFAWVEARKRWVLSIR